MGNYTLSKGEGGEKGKFFCSPHYRQLFLSHPEIINYARRQEPTLGKPDQDEKVDIPHIKFKHT